MMILALIAILVGAVVLILIVETAFRDSAWLAGLRNWQQGLGALLGLVSVALAVQLQHDASERARELSARQDAAAATLALYVEANMVDHLITDIAGSLDPGGRMQKGQGASEEELRANGYCRVMGEYLTPKAQPELGLFAAHQQQIGRLKANLPYLFAQFSVKWRELNETFRNAKSTCESSPSDFEPVLVRRISSMTDLIKKIETEMKNSGDFKLIADPN